MKIEVTKATNYFPKFQVKSWFTAILHNFNNKPYAGFGVIYMQIIFNYQLDDSFKYQSH